MIRVRFAVVALLLLSLLAGALPARAQDSGQDNTIALDEGGFGAVKQDALAPGAEAAYTVDLKAGDRVALDLQGETDGLQVVSFAAAYGPLELASPAPFNYLAWAPEDGNYTITVKNTGDAAGGFTMRLAVSAAPLPAKKVLTADADGQTIPVSAGEPFQVALDAQTGTGYAWTLGAFDGAILTQDGDPATVLLGTMPGAPSQQIFTFTGVAPGTAALDFSYAKAGSDPEQSYSVTIEVAAADATSPAAEEPVKDEPAADEPAAEPEPTPILPEPIGLDQGNVLVIPLAGNPTTGYTWLALPSAEGILTQRGDPAYMSGSDLPGAGGYQIFTFDAVAGGDVKLTFTYRQPWDETTPPSELFVLPFTVAAPPPAPAAPPAPVTIGEAENGSTVELQSGGLLFVDLPGNPTTGYIWQVTDKDEAVLAPTDYEFRPSSGAMGAGGVEHFEFAAVAPGEVTLAFAQSRPWETDAEPAATYTVTVKVVAPAE